MSGATPGGDDGPRDFRILSGDAIHAFVDDELFDPTRTAPIATCT